MVAQVSVERLAQALKGVLIQPSDPEYEEARHVYNGMIDRHPRLIARCSSVADVVAAVNFARDEGMVLSIRGGGHNVTGFGTNDGGIVIDMSLMKEIKIDAEMRTVRVQGGCTWGDVDRATHPHGFATPGGVISTTGIAGLSLGGGVGYLTRKYGLSCDNLISADVVTADGKLVTASDQENQDLLWALRGGGGNFGVVTSFQFRLHPVSTVFAGPILWPVEKAGDAMRAYRDFMAQAPDDVNAFFAFLIVPPGEPFPPELHNRTLCGVICCYTGDLEKGGEALRPLREFGPPAFELLGPMPFPMLQSMFDALLPPGLQHYWKADFLTDLTDGAIDANLKFGPAIPTVNSAVHIYPVDGAASRPGRNDTAWSYREARFVEVIAAVNGDPSEMPANTAWVRDYWSALHPHSAGGAYVNMMMDEGPERIAASYRDNYPRLVDIKRKYDPTNLFRMNQNIDPSGAK